MAVQPYTEFPEVKESSVCSWLCCHTDPESSLHKAENRIFNHVKTTFEANYVNISSTENKDCLIWTLSFNKESDKLPLVLIHGLASAVGLWCLNLDAFAAQRPVYAFDLLGFGRSSRISFSDDALEAELQFVQSIEEWRKRMCLEQFILLGHSMGGFLASSYALKYPDRVSHLILADPWGFSDYPGKDDPYAQLPPSPWIRAAYHLLKSFNPLCILRTIGLCGPPFIRQTRSSMVGIYSDVIDEANEVIPEYIYRCNVQNPTGESAFRAMMFKFKWAKYPMIHRLPALKSDIPITFICGGRSWIDPKTSYSMKDIMKNSSVHVHILPDAGHLLYADKYEEFNSYVLKASESADRAKQIHSVSDFRAKNSLNAESVTDAITTTLQSSETVITSASIIS